MRRLSFKFIATTFNTHGIDGIHLKFSRPGIDGVSHQNKSRRSRSGLEFYSHAIQNFKMISVFKKRFRRNKCPIGFELDRLFWWCYGMPFTRSANTIIIFGVCPFPDQAVFDRLNRFFTSYRK